MESISWPARANRNPMAIASRNVPKKPTPASGIRSFHEGSSRSPASSSSANGHHPPAPGHSSWYQGPIFLMTSSATSRVVLLPPMS